MTYTATYSPEDNKIRVSASSRLDKETYDRVRSTGFIWAPKQEIFVAPMWTPEREDLAIELAGEIGDEDTSLVERAEERAERFEEYRESRISDAQAAKAHVDRIADGVPMGQPILIGHHSERHARKDAEKIENGMRKAVKMWDTAQYWKSRAAGAIRHAKYKELPRVRANRIKTLEADKRKQERTKSEADMWLKLWLACENEADKELQKQVALKIANMCWLHMPRKAGDREDFAHSPTAYDALTNNSPTLYAPRTLDEVIAAAKATYPRAIAHAERWIAHLDNRLLYERAMLQEAGESHRLEKAPRPKQLPLCNYRAPEGLSIENIYHRSEMIHYPQVEMTQAEYTAINVDYKSTRVIGNSHRVRTALRRGDLVCVFLTDSKVHSIPEPIEKAAPKPRPVPTYTPAPVVEPNEFDAMKDTLRAGIKVVSAPQLFPTPKDLASRMVDEAGITAEHEVLEPSAGTGNICEAITAVGANVYAVEINMKLAEMLSNRGFQVLQGDFLECNGNLGQFERIIMNPPFENGADIKHIEHALHMLKPGGRLVAICANGPRQQERLRALAENSGGYYEPLPADTFKVSGTSVNTALVVIEG